MASSLSHSFHSASTSVCHTESARDDESVDSWQWESTLDSLQSGSNRTFPRPDSNISIAVKTDTDEVPKTASLPSLPLPLAMNFAPQHKLSANVCFKKVFKKVSAIMSDTLGTLRWRKVYQIERKPSIKLFNSVRLLEYRGLEDRISPVEFVLNYLCKTAKDVQELRENPQRVAHLIKGDVDAVLQDVAFALSKAEQVAAVERRRRGPQAFPSTRLRVRSLVYLDSRSPPASTS